MLTSSRSLIAETQGSQLHRRDERWVAGTLTQRMQKALVQMNIQLTEVLSDVMGSTGQAIIRAVVDGERDPKVLARHRHSRVKASAEEISPRP